MDEGAFYLTVYYKTVMFWLASLTSFHIWCSERQMKVWQSSTFLFDFNRFDLWLQITWFHLLENLTRHLSWLSFSVRVFRCFSFVLSVISSSIPLKNGESGGKTLKKAKITS